MTLNDWYTEDWDDVEDQPISNTLEGIQNSIIFNSANGTFSKVEVKPVQTSKYGSVEQDGEEVIKLLLTFCPKLSSQVNTFSDDVRAECKEFGFGEFDEVTSMLITLDLIAHNDFTITQNQLNELFNKMEENNCLDADFARFLLKHTK